MLCHINKCTGMERGPIEGPIKISLNSVIYALNGSTQRKARLNTVAFI